MEQNRWFHKVGLEISFNTSNANHGEIIDIKVVKKKNGTLSDRILVCDGPFGTHPYCIKDS